MFWPLKSTYCALLAAPNATVSVVLMNCVQPAGESEIVEFANIMQVLAVQIVLLTRIPIK